jgi:hypothetical protein
VAKKADTAFEAVTCLEERNAEEKIMKWLPFIRMGIWSILLTTGKGNSYNTT